jgi:hypothetical protein
MDKTEFIQLEEFESHEDESPDSILEQAQKKLTSKKEAPKEEADPNGSDLLDELGI